MVREPASLQLLVYSPFLREEHLVLRVQIFPTKTAWSFRNRLFLGKTDPPPPRPFNSNRSQAASLEDMLSVS